MGTTDQQFLYMLAEDLYRLGNYNSAKLNYVRPVDIITYESNGIEMVRATGMGVSVGTLEYIRKLGLSGWLWKIPARIACRMVWYCTQIQTRRERVIFSCPPR